MKITIPELSLVVLIGPSGSGKSTFASRHFKPTEVLSSDACRGMVSDDENNQTATAPAFEVLHFIAAKRLAAGRLTVVDATNVQAGARQPLVALAREYHCLPVAVAFDLPERLCHDRNRARSDRSFGPHVVRQQVRELRRSLGQLKKEGFRHVYVLESPEEVEAAAVERQPLWNNRRHDHGPFDVIGDIHGCADELSALLSALGYMGGPTGAPGQAGPLRHPQGRKAVFLGDLVDRGPKTPEVLRLVMGMVREGSALCVPGNHDMKLMRKLRGRDVHISHGLAESLAQLESEAPAFKEAVASFLDGLVSHYVLDDGKLVVAHAGIKEPMQGRGSGRVRDFALYGETTGETDEYGLPVRLNWPAEYRGPALVAYGHTPVPEPQWLNNTVNIDTGCVFGGRLTALRYPEREIVSVPALRVYYQPARPFLAEAATSPFSAQQEHDELLDMADVTGKRQIGTRLHHAVTIREENAITALEVMSRFAADPRWLIYLPPTMSPCETSRDPGLLEHPAGAFDYYRAQGVPTVICQEKHMGSRAVMIACRDEAVARKRFGVAEPGLGLCATRTGRRFFDEPSLEQAILSRLGRALEASGLWEALNTDWVCLDAEVMPWSAKAQSLLREQYAAVGAASRAAFGETIPLLSRAQSRGLDLASLVQAFRERADASALFVEAYRRYCWPVKTVDDFRIAAFHLLATEGKVHVDRNHLWHMETLSRLCAADPLFRETSHRVVDVTDERSQRETVGWWEDLTSRGGEGMVVKPLDFVARGSRGLVQPAVKCRGPEYLRIIYGPDYRLPGNLDRLRVRGLAHKRSLALREFALGVEGLERFVRREPLRRVHECVFGVLALESEPVDPRL